MRMIFSVLSLLVVLAIVGVVAKKQLSAGVAPSAAVPGGAPALTGTPQQQVDQYKKAVEGALQQSRPMPDEGK